MKIDATIHIHHHDNSQLDRIEKKLDALTASQLDQQSLAESLKQIQDNTKSLAATREAVEEASP